MNSENSKKLNTNSNYSVTVLSNITNINFVEILQNSFNYLSNNIEFLNGNYDNVIQDSFRFSNKNCIIIFLEICNYFPHLHIEIEDFDEKKFNELLDKISVDIKIICENLRTTPLVLFNSFSSLAFSSNSIKISKLDLLCEKLNLVLKSNISSNQLIVNIDKIIANIGIHNCFDYRFYFNYKSLYTPIFFKKYAEIISPTLHLHLGLVKKVLILDCDNTLWSGVIGEDGPDGIEMGPNHPKGIYFYHAQKTFLRLQRNGVLLALCSKNNLNDVENILNFHQDFLIKKESFILKKINWLDKVSNIKEISKSLNLGLDSFVFLDDSDFEIEHVKSELPQVTCLKVPKNLSSYHLVLDQIELLFFNPNLTNEDLVKTQMYLENIMRKDLFDNSNSIENYLSSLGLTISIKWNENVPVIRSSQMTQKTNQFNLTTLRLSEAEILSKINSKEYEVCTISVSDKFGDSGVTGLAIIKINTATSSCEIEVFLLSCRIIGRHIEFKFFELILDKLTKFGINEIFANYFRTEKNIQVQNFYDILGFKRTCVNNDSISYILNINSYIKKNYPYIKVQDDEFNV